MANGYNLGDLRAAIVATNREIVEEKESGEVHNLDVLDRLKTKRPELINLYASQLIDMALIKLLNDASRTKSAKKAIGSQIELFDGFRGIPSMVVTSSGNKKPTEKMTVAEGYDWLRDHSKKTVDNQNSEFRRLIDWCEKKSSSDTETIEDIINRSRESENSQGELEMSGG